MRFMRGGGVAYYIGYENQSWNRNHWWWEIMVREWESRWRKRIVGKRVIIIMDSRDLLFFRREWTICVYCVYPAGLRTTVIMRNDEEKQVADALPTSNTLWPVVAAAVARHSDGDERLAPLTRNHMPPPPAINYYHYIRTSPHDHPPDSRLR